MALNSNNFLRWDGIFIPLAYTLSNTSLPLTTLFANEESCTCTPLSGATSSNGLDFSSFTITLIHNDTTTDPIVLASPPEWNPDTQVLTCFRPLDLTLTEYFIVFSISDLLGNVLTGCIQTVEVSTVYTTWLVYPSSATCLLDNFGNNTGYQLFTQLVLANSSTSAYISPLTLKANQPSDSDYIAPAQNFVSCPAPGAGSGIYSVLIISNFSKNSASPTRFITITNIYLQSSNMGPGGTPLAQNFPCNIPPGQSLRLNVPATSIGFTYDGGITISYLATGDMTTASPLRYWVQVNSGVPSGFPSGGVTSNIVDNSGIINGSPLLVPSPAGITIFAQ